MVERAFVVEQAEQQRTDVRTGPVLVPAEPRHHAVGRALVLDLEHRALAGLVRGVEPLGHDAVETGTLEVVEPVGRERAVAGRGGEVDRRRGVGEDGLEAGAALLPGLWSRRSSSPSASRSQATNDAGDSAASIFTRDAAGWIRSRSASKSSEPSREMTTSPSSTQRSGSAALSGATSSGK